MVGRAQGGDQDGEAEGGGENVGKALVVISMRKNGQGRVSRFRIDQFE